jgi:hypothetical protein
VKDLAGGNPPAGPRKANQTAEAQTANGGNPPPRISGSEVVKLADLDDVAGDARRSIRPNVADDEQGRPMTESETTHAVILPRDRVIPWRCDLTAHADGWRPQKHSPAEPVNFS